MNLTPAQELELLKAGYDPRSLNTGVDLRNLANAGLDVGQGLTGKYMAVADPLAHKMQDGLTSLIGRAGGATKMGGAVGRFAASPKVLGALKLVPGLGAVTGALGAGDIILGDDSLGNKSMDTILGVIGGALGSVGGPLGTAAGFGTGKAVSDGIQFIVGGGKSEEERAREEALRILGGMN